MEKKQIRKEIAALINSIKEHSDNIGEKEQIPQLELELILHKIEKLYQKSIVYNHLNSEEAAAIIRPERKEEKAEKAEEKIVVPEPKMEAPVIQPPLVEPPKAELPEVEILKVEIPKTELPKEEPKPEIKPEEIKEVKKEEPKPEVKPLEKKDNPTQVPVGSFQKPPIADLRAAIGINDRFQFANELFGGEMQEYEIAIQQLNAAETWASALAYFNSLQQLYSWDSEHETVKRLLDLVERRYS